MMSMPRLLITPRSSCSLFLDVQGSIPDMTALTATYLELQRLYRDRAEADQAALAGHVQSIEQTIGQAAKIPTISIRNFAKNARNLRYL